ncbi:proteasome complex subunit rpn13 ubiquitin receptor domain-containing protein [Rhizoctonia solani]|uniref:Proteasome complex subunit rpn13 ubiquitin receptor domain-containing protein n=1 Tax=Rhizoctonia solani TaxID=456999 RepID=A0A8H8PC16_9AGAM|nr:proteasome complex subunit rpn13 ubiquitin receptor domain-containing protein [Rhizoctonia solani]QRW27107.1 proteasome complex subunit rpn13 ubiquitin receptor domain-containing protein [Rhizoctonia solani]
MYVLKFQSSDQLHFFWLQDPDKSLSGPTESIGSSIRASNNSVQAPTGPLNPEQLNSVVQEILRNLQGHSRAGVAPDVALSDILTPSILATVLQDSEVVNSLTQFLPVELLSSPYATQVPLQEVMKQTVASAPFRSSVRSLDQALSTGLLGGLVTSLGMPVEAGLGIHPFLEAIEKQARGHGKTTRDKGGREKRLGVIHRR